MLALALLALGLACPNVAADGRTEAKAALRGIEEPGARVRVLEERVAKDDRAAPSPETARFVGFALDDERALVRKRAAELLAEGLHAPTALEELVRAAKKQPQWRREAQARVDKAVKKIPKPPPPDSSRPLDVKKLSEAIDVAGDAAKESIAVEDQRQALVQALARFKDDRAIDAILGTRDVDFRAGFAIDALALLEFGTLNALEGAVARVADLARAIDESERQLDDLRKVKADADEERRRPQIFETVKKSCEALHADEARVRAAFTAFATARELAAPPTDLHAAAAWRAWLDAARAELPPTIAPPPAKK